MTATLHALELRLQTLLGAAAYVGYVSPGARADRRPKKYPPRGARQVTTGQGEGPIPQAF